MKSEESTGNGDEKRPETASVCSVSECRADTHTDAHAHRCAHTDTPMLGVNTQTYMCTNSQTDMHNVFPTFALVQVSLSSTHLFF